MNNWPTETAMNLSAVERWVSSVAGVAMTVSGLRQRSLRGALMAAGGAALVARGATGYCPVHAVVGAYGRAYDTREALGGRRGVHVDESIMINRPAHELYALWRALDRLPEFIPVLKSVDVIDTTHSHWRAEGPGGRVVQWDAVLLNDIPNELIAWRTIGEADVVSAGSVRFVRIKGRSETQMRVRLQYEPPGGKSAAALAWLFGRDPGQLIRTGLRRFKALLETGEIPTTAGQARGMRRVFGDVSRARPS